MECGGCVHVVTYPVPGGVDVAAVFEALTPRFLDDEPTTARALGRRRAPAAAEKGSMDADFVMEAVHRMMEMAAAEEIIIDPRLFNGG